jgi:nitrate/nitrite transport system ATP-binding protein
MNSHYLECQALRKSFPSPRGPACIVRDFNMCIAEGQFVSIIGHSGCGKSTVLSMIAGLLPSTGGRITLSGKEVRGPGPDRGVVFQAPCLLPWLTALDNVLLGVDQVMPKESRRHRRDVAVHYLTLVGLRESFQRKPDELSGGMRQRVGIARAFALGPKMLLLDEPFGMLDQLTRFELQQVLLELWREDRKTALMVTHDVDEALFLSDRIVMMTSGPAATVGAVMDVSFPRPRDRTAIMEHPEYYRLRERLIGYLESQHAHSRAAPAVLEPELMPADDAPVDETPDIAVAAA